MPTALASQPAPQPPDLSDRIPPLIPRQRVKATSKPLTPPPPTPALTDPLPLSSITFTHPTRRILMPADLRLFLASPTHTLLVSFIFTIADAITGVPISSRAAEPPHPTIAGVLAILAAAHDLLDDTPPGDNNGSRFGNPAFRAFHARLTARLPALHAHHLPALPAGAREELCTYLGAAFGSAQRLDYGSGHELHFFVHALALYRCGALPRAALPAVALALLPAYLRLARAAQAAYYLEPAGSHGVWGLDDFQFLPFLLGAAQLAGHPTIRPLAIHSAATLDAEASDWLYLDAVRHVNATKTVPGLRWHSPLLDDISGVRHGWARIDAGLRRMFLAELLAKLPVMQHFLFGGLVPVPDGVTPAVRPRPGDWEGEAEVAPGHTSHAHNQDAWGDCCGIRVPSGVGAKEEMRKRMGVVDGLRPLPFD